MNVRSWMTMILAVSTVMVSYKFRQAMPALTVILFFLPAILLIVYGRWRVLFTYCAVLLISHGGRLPLIKPYYMYLPNMLLMFFGIMRYLLPGFTLFYLMVSVTTVSGFINSMRRMKVPMTVILALSVIFRFFPTVRSERQSMSGALRLEGINLAYTLRHPIKSLSFSLIPLLTCSARIGEELSMASLCRGLSISEERTLWPGDILNRLDVAVISLSLLTLLLWGAVLLGLGGGNVIF